MEPSFNHIHIFKTNITKENLAQIKTIFNRTKSISHWNVDTDDCDLVLRVESRKLSESQVMELVTGFGFECEELA